MPLGDGDVPYDDFDASPYEEDYLFGGPDRPLSDAVGVTRQVPVSASGQTQTSQPAASLRAQTSAPMSVPKPEPMPTPIPEPVPVPQPTPEPVPEPVSELAPAPEPVPEPEPTTAAAPTPEPESAPQEQQAPTKRTRRQSGGIPEDLIAMMTKIFGEGITYTSEAPDEPAEPEEAVDFEGEDVASGEEGYDAEGDFADEPVDDADYEEDE